MTQTVPAPPSPPKERTPSQLALSKFGTIGYDLYLQVVLAESARLYQGKQTLGSGV